jgi:hypothetical protein
MSSEVVTPEAVPSNGGAEDSKPLEKAVPTITPVVYDPGDVVGLYMNTGVFTQLQRVANLMASSNLAPAHLRKQVADCFLVAAQAFRWGMDPFSVAQHTFVLSGKLGYEGKLIAAVVNTHPKIERKLDYVYQGEGQNRTVIVSARLRGEEKDRIISGTVKLWATDNKKWLEMPDQMLAYRGAREWARRHMPEAVLGIQAEEELTEIAVPRTPKPRSLDALTESIETAVAPPAPRATEEPKVVAQPLPDREPGSDDDDEVEAQKFIEATDCVHPNLKRPVPKGKTYVCPDCTAEVKG